MGAIAIIEITAPRHEIDRVLDRMGAPALGVGQRRVVHALGLDDAVIVRWSDGLAHAMVHGGGAILSAFARELENLGVAHTPDAAPARPEACDAIEARLLDALAIAASPRVVDLLLDHAARWRDAPPHEAISPGHARQLARLIRPPSVALVGPPNCGKSTLTNALAGRGVSIVSSEPGTTRDHVGVTLVLDGLAVRWIDTPGLRADGPEPERDAIARAAGVVRSCDAIVLCGDRETGRLGPESLTLLGLAARTPVLDVAMRCDRFGPGGAGELGVSGETGAGLHELARGVRGLLVSDAAMNDPGLWAFWDAAEA
jgi:hypothetical protein